MTVLERYIELKSEFEVLNSQTRTMAYTLRDLAARLDAPVNQQPKGSALDLPDIGECSELLSRRLEAWNALNDAWEALPDYQRAHLSAPVARLPIPL